MYQLHYFNLPFYINLERSRNYIFIETLHGVVAVNSRFGSTHNT